MDVAFYLFQAYASLQSRAAWKNVVDTNPELWAELEKKFLNHTVHHPEDKLMDMESAIDSYLDPCEGTFKHCSLQGRPFSCCPLVHRAVDSDGPCLSLSPSHGNGSRMTQASHGAKYGLRLFLNSGLRDQMDGLASGFQLHLHFAPNDEFKVTDPVNVSPGTETWVEVRGVEELAPPSTSTYAFLYAPQPPCSRAAALPLSRGAYSQDGCEADCQHRLFIDLCNCTRLGSLRPQVPVCGPTEALRCAGLYWELESSSELAAARDACAGNCLPACRRKYLTSSASDVHYAWDGSCHSRPQKTMMKALRRLTEDENITEEFGRGLINLRVFYPESRVKRILTAERFTVDGVISSVGGVMGIWAGASLLSLVQLLALLARLFYSVLASLVPTKYAHRDIS